MDCYFESACSIFFWRQERDSTAGIGAEPEPRPVEAVPRASVTERCKMDTTRNRNRNRKKEKARCLRCLAKRARFGEFPIFNLLPISQCLHHAFASFYSPRFNLHHFTVLFQRSYRVTGEPKDTFALQGHEPSHRATHPAERLQSRRFSTKSTSVKKQ